jgi:hypothetical protein
MKLLAFIIVLLSTALVVDAAPKCDRCRPGEKPRCGVTAKGEKVLIACKRHCWTIV